MMNELTKREALFVELTKSHLPIFNLMGVGISLLTWDSVELEKIHWIFVNDFRCSMTGFSREEIVSKPITVRSTREARSIYENYKAHIEEHGSFSCETTLLHKNLSAVPVILNMSLVTYEGEVCLLSELHDITPFKKTEKQLNLSRESTREMLSLIEKDKQKITENIEGNLGLVLFPLMDQLRISATEAQKEVLDLMVRRVGDVCREVGITTGQGEAGATLTRRQMLICEMIRDGMTSKEIALALDCSPSTVNNHRNTIRRKLNLSGRGANLQAWLNSGVGLK
jgi:PAS domain S-box-containing protein